MHSTTTLSRIVALSEAEQALLNQPEWSDADRAQFQTIRDQLDQLWPIRRAELVFERAGPPRIVGASDPRSIRQIERAIAYGIAPLPMSGGD